MDNEKELGTILAQNIQHYLDRDKMSRKELADRLGVSTSSVGFWLTGNKIPRSDKVDAMCRVFGCRRSDLLTEQTGHQKYTLSAEDRIMQYALKIAQMTARSRDEVFNFIDFKLNTDSTTNSSNDTNLK